jgi:predicted short-subunit dehydrogenase-like oxidoreductase (DUF2520 family)
MAGKPRIAIVGAGNLGSALARALHNTGYDISEIIYRSGGSPQRSRRLAAQVGSMAAPLSKARLGADAVWVCVPDSSIRRCASEMARVADWRGKVVLHPSGALPSSELQPLRSRGAAVAAVHPLMTFVRRSSPPMEGIPFAVEGDATAVRAAQHMVRILGGEAFSIRPQDKALYHAWGAFASPLLIALLSTAEQVAKAAGVRSAAAARRRMLPILQQTLRNYEKLGPAAAFSGPLIRGDVPTVRRHLNALTKLPRARAVYVALAQGTLYALPVRNRGDLGKALNTESPPRRRERQVNS